MGWQIHGRSVHFGGPLVDGGNLGPCEVPQLRGRAGLSALHKFHLKGAAA